jgi:hypothetical protein
MSSSSHGPLRFLLRIAVFVVLVTAVAEVCLRTALPASDIPPYFQDASTKIFRFDPAGRPSGRVTEGRLPRRAGEWLINDAGWNSVVDYLPAGRLDQPIVALLGDSYVEGFATDVDKHVDAYLGPLLDPQAKVYAFGSSAWYLEQYVAVSRYAAERFDPDLFIILIGDRDITDSLSENGVISPNFFQIERVDELAADASGQGPEEADERTAGFREVPPSEIYSASWKSRLARRSALIRYLRFNAHVALPGMQNVESQQPGAAADGGGAVGSWRDLLPAADYMVARLCADHPGVPILFVSHSDRYLSVAKAKSTPLYEDPRAVRAACSGHPQCHFLDLRLTFSRDWAAHHQLFEAVDGGHWNAYANRLVARRIALLVEQQRLLEGD